MAEIKAEILQEQHHDLRAESLEMLAQTDYRVRTQGPSKLGQDLLAIRQEALTEGLELLSDEVIDQFMAEGRRQSL